jgi:PmbA protein
MKMEAEIAVKKALSLGATEAEAYVQRTKKVQVEGAGRIENLSTIESLGIGLRVVIGKRLAMHSTSILKEEEIEGAVVKAVKIARVASEDHDWRHMNSRFGMAVAEGYCDDALEDLDYGEVVEKAKSAVSLMQSHDERVRPTRMFIVAGTQNVSIANSCGESCERRETAASVSMSAKAREAGMESTGSENQQARFWKEVNFEDLALKAAEKSVRFLRAKPIASGTMPIVVRNTVFARILGGLFWGPVSADWVQKGRSPLTDKIGAEIASEDITILDDGLMHRGWRTKPFDEEGHPTQRTPIVEKAVLRGFLYDSYTALKDNVESTGNAQRESYSSTPQPSPNNLVLKPGGASPEELIRETKQGVYVEDVIGEWMSNPVSGSLTATMTHGYLIENGELTDPIKGVVISGNFYELLKGGMELGSDLRNSFHYYSPTVKLTQLTIAGK